MFLGSCWLDTLALVGGTVHSLEAGREPRVATVLVVDGKIAAVGAELALPAGANVVDARGLHLIPGLIDGFAYHDPEHDLLYVAGGVTLVRDHGNDLAQIFDSRERNAGAQAIGPALSVSGAVFDGVPPSTAAALVVRSADEAKHALERLAAEEIDFVSFQASLAREPWAALCAGAKELDLRVWGPRVRGMSLDDALAGGQTGFVFLDCLLPDGATWESVEIVACEPAARKLGAVSASVTPVLRGHARMLDATNDVALLERMSPQYAALWTADAEQRAKTIDAAARRKIEVLHGKQRALMSSLRAAGVALVPGSGAPHPWMAPGVGLQRELVEWQELGVPASAVLRAATADAAKALGLDEERGTIAVGKVADIVALRADPEVDVRALSEVELVVLRGQFLARGELDQRLAALEARQEAARASFNKPVEVTAPALPEGKLLLSGRVETNTAVGPLAAERWAIVKEVDGTLTFCGRRALRVAAGRAETVVDVRQRVSNGKLASFDVKSTVAGRELAVRGFILSEQWRIERRMDGAFVDNRGAIEMLAAIDVGSVTTMMLLAHTRGAGHFPVLRFDEGLEVEVVRWDLDLDEDGDHAFRTPQGLKFAGFFENGALKMVVEQKGQASLQTMSMELDDKAPGLPLPAAKLELMRKAVPASSDK